MDEILGLQLFKVSPVWIITMPVMSLGQGCLVHFRMGLKGCELSLLSASELESLWNKESLVQFLLQKLMYSGKAFIFIVQSLGEDFKATGYSGCMVY